MAWSIDCVGVQGDQGWCSHSAVVLDGCSLNTEYPDDVITGVAGRGWRYARWGRMYHLPCLLMDDGNCFRSYNMPPVEIRKSQKLHDGIVRYT